MISVVVRCGAPDDDLAACVDSLASQAGAAPCEILATGRESREPLAPLKGGAAARCRRISPDEADRAIAANTAAGLARGTLLVFLGADTILLPGGLTAMLATAVSTDRVVLGPVAFAKGSDELATAESRRDSGPAIVDLSVCEGQVLAVPAAVFHRIAGFTARLRWGDQIDLVYRLRQEGIEVRQLPTPVGRTARPWSASRAIRARLEAGRGNVDLYNRTPALLPHLELGGFHAGHAPGLRLRRVLLTLGAPSLPNAFGVCLPIPRWRRGWLSFLRDYHFWRGVRQALGTGQRWRSLLRPPVILMYHAIGGPDEHAGCYVVPMSSFERQLDWLRRRGYRVLGLEELLAYRRAHELPPARAVVITFDDGYRDNRERAVGALRARGLTATFFLVSDAIGGQNVWDDSGELAGRRMLSWDDVRMLRDAGMGIGSHTRTHPVLPHLPVPMQRQEVEDGRRVLERELGLPVLTFAYPYGRLDSATTAAVAEAGVEAACCSRSGVNDPSVPDLLLRRVEVRGTDSLLRFALAVHRGWARRRRSA